MKTTRRFDLILTLAGLLGAILFFTLYDQAFPSAALELDLSRREVAQLAQETLQAYGYDLEGYKFALSFEEDSWSSYFLQRTLGIPKTNQLIQEEGLPVWYWHARWFRPLQKEEFALNIATDGRVTGFSHSIEEDTPGASLPEAQAQKLAEGYLAQELGWDLSQWEPVSASSEDRPGGRTDHYFSWKRSDFDVGQSELRLSVGVQGDRIGSFGYWLKVPEDFTRDFSEQSNRATFISDLCYYAGTFVLSLAAMIFFFLGLIRHAMPRHSAFLIASLIGILTLATRLNYLPLYRMGYETTKDYSQFWLEILFSILIGTIAAAAFIFLIWSGSERMGKLAWPRQEKILPSQGDRWIALTRSWWRGLMLFGIKGTYVLAFYFVITRLLGGWTPMEVDYSNLYATPVPFLGPLAVGLMPAVREETVSRLAGIALIFGLTRRRWLAILIPGALWAGAHISYVRDPIYLRGIELLPVAILYALFFLRFGLVTTIAAHMTYNASLGMLPMLRSGEPYFIFSGLVVALALLAPMLPGLYRLAQRRWRGQPMAEAQPAIGSAASSDLSGLAALPIQGVDWDELLNDPDRAVYCLRVDEKVIGAAVGRLEGETGKLEAVYVAREWRGRYWGSALSEAVCATLQEKGAQAIQADLQARDRLALAFISGQGWRAQRQVFGRGPLPSFPDWRSWLRKRIKKS